MSFPGSAAGNSYLDALLADRDSWDASACQLGADLRELMYLYCFDVETGCCWLGEVAYSSFCDIRREVNEGGESDAHTQRLDSLITRSALDRKLLPLSHGFSPDDLLPMETALIEELACVIARSPWAADIGLVYPGCHLVAVRLRDDGARVLLCFAASVSENRSSGPLSDTELIKACQGFLAAR